MARLIVAAVVVIGLALGVWWLWPSDPAGPSTTVPMAQPPTTPPTATSSTTATTTPDTHVVETVEQAEAVLRDLWFGWFEGIYLGDEDRIREVVATEEQVESAREQFGVMEFTAAPTPEALVFEELEILRADERCTAIWATANASAFRGPQAVGSGVWVLRKVGSGWFLTTLWLYREDLWEQDCEASL